MIVTNRIVASLFEKSPGGWGLRGDPYLWQEMKQEIIETNNEFCDVNTIEKYLHGLFFELTGFEITGNNHIHIKRYLTIDECSGHGMSAGCVSPEWWLRTGVTSILNRYKNFVLKQIYPIAYDFLLSKEGITKDDIEKQLIPVVNKPNNLREIYKSFCESAQNRQMSPNIIGGSIDGVEKLSDVLCSFDPKEVAKTYSHTESEKLLDIIIKKLNPKGQIRTTARSIWPQYCKSVIDSAHFLSQFGDANTFYEWADYFSNDTRSKVALPLLISIEIDGFGFPLACDILKELGYSNFGKPDVHLKDIFSALNIIDSNEKNEMKQNLSTLKAIDKIAELNNVTSYAVDKIFWLIGSGKFYLTNKNIGSRKNEFIEYIKTYKM